MRVFLSVRVNLKETFKFESITYLHFFSVDEEQEEEDDSNDESNDEEEIEHIQDDFEPETNDKSNDKEEVEHIQDDFEPETSTDTILKHVSPAAKRQFTAMAPPDFSPIERQGRSASMNISNRSFKSPRATSKTPLNNSNYPNLSLKEIRMNSPKTSNRSMNNSPARSPMVKVCDI